MTRYFLAFGQRRGSHHSFGLRIGCLAEDKRGWNLQTAASFRRVEAIRTKLFTIAVIQLQMNLIFPPAETTFLGNKTGDKFSWYLEKIGTMDQMNSFVIQPNFTPSQTGIVQCGCLIYQAIFEAPRLHPGKGVSMSMQDSERGDAGFGAWRCRIRSL